MPVPFLIDYQSYSERREGEQPSSLHAEPLVTIVTVTLNAAATLERTIRSVQAQTQRGIEQVFVDGGSTDGTIEIIRCNAREQDYWISEKDRGISDAFNKGVAMARGRYLQILNADDWLSANQIERAVTVLTESKADFVFGDLIFYEEGKPVFTYIGEADYQRSIHRRMPALNHPTVLAARALFARIGLFDMAYRTAMDYDWLLRLHRAGGSGTYCASILGHMTHEGVSNRQFRRTIAEVRTIAIVHGRGRLIASLDAMVRLCKTTASRSVKRHATPLYQRVRKIINPSYHPVPIKS